MAMVERLMLVDEEPRGMVYGFIPRGIEEPVTRDSPRKTRRFLLTGEETKLAAMLGFLLRARDSCGVRALRHGEDDVPEAWSHGSVGEGGVCENENKAPG
jgi:hypothetical protein